MISESVHILGLLFWITIAAFFFAKVEIQIEGSEGWAAGLPTWRIERHWLLNIFWGGRAMTGYHAWVFPFMAIIFHFPIAVFGMMSWKYEARIIGSLMVFWIIEDFLWFVFNPAFGWKKFGRENVPWHKYWFLYFPTDYWTFTIAGTLLIAWSFSSRAG